MKANAPEKIYLQDSMSTDTVGDLWPEWFDAKVSDDSIEYVRTDAFIERAEEFIYIALNDGIMGTANIEDFMRLFKNYLKGE